MDRAAVTWTDIGCDVHEVTVDTGRSSTSDLFQPGTAVITASNVSGWADGTAPIDWSYFADDFERNGPALGSHWERWAPMETAGPADALVIDDGAAQVQARPSASSGSAPPTAGCAVVDTYSAVGNTPSLSAQIGPFPGAAEGDIVVLSLQVRIYNLYPIKLPGGWPAAGIYEGSQPVAGMDEWRHDYYRHVMTGEEAAFGVPWHASWPVLAPWTWTAVVVRNTNAVRAIDGNTTFWEAGVVGAFNDSSGAAPTPTAGCVLARFYSGEHHHNIPGSPAELVQASGAWDAMHFCTVEGPLPFDTPFTPASYPWSSPSTAADGETTQGWVFMFTPGPPPDAASVPMEGSSCALWGEAFAGEHFIDAIVTGLAAPDRVWPSATTTIELCLHANPTDLAMTVARIDWEPSWDDPDHTGTLSWSVDRRTAAGAPSGAGPFITGSSDLGGPFPEPAHFRFESDTGGALRLWLDGDLLGAGTDPAPRSGGQVGVYSSFYAGSLSYGRTHQPGPPRFEDVVGGANHPPPILLEPGVHVRIGVHHAVYGDVWFFHGYVDGIVPVYDPERRAVSNIECIDALGEVGRLPSTDIGGVQPEEAHQRITRLLDEAAWPVSLRVVEEDATWMDNSHTTVGRVVDHLTGTADSCGGAVYGDPESGKVVFRARDWHAWEPEAPPDGYITNGPTPPGALTACPSPWERSWKREDMTTRATLTSGNSEEFTFANPDAEARYGVEPYSRSLVAIEPRIMYKLGRRQLRLRGPEAFPRVSGVLLDAATSEGAIDVMTLASFTVPSRYLCELNVDGVQVFSRQYFVTGLNHTMTRDRWSCRLALDTADVYATRGARWGIGRWGGAVSTDVWGLSI